MAEYECSYNVTYSNYDCNDNKCTTVECICDNNDKTIVVHIKTDFVQFRIEYYVFKRTYDEFVEALKFWDNDNKTRFIFPGVGGHVLLLDDKQWYLESYKHDCGHSPYYQYKIHLAGPDKIISTIEQIRDSLKDYAY